VTCLSSVTQLCLLAFSNYDRDHHHLLLRSLPQAMVQRPTERLGMEAHEACLKKLIQLGINVNILDKDGNTPLLLAAAAGNRSPCVMLSKNGADLKLKNRMKEHFIHCAVRGGNAHLVQMAVRVPGLSVHDKSHNGTPLEMANERSDLTQILLTSGSGTISRAEGAAMAALLASAPDPEKKVCHPHSPLHVVVRSCPLRVDDPLCRIADLPVDLLTSLLYAVAFPPPTVLP
jgi:Ankyrin repeats (many copies)